MSVGVAQIVPNLGVVRRGSRTGTRSGTFRTAYRRIRREIPGTCIGNVTAVPRKLHARGFSGHDCGSPGAAAAPRDQTTQSVASSYSHKKSYPQSIDVDGLWRPADRCRGPARATVNSPLLLEPPAAEEDLEDSPHQERFPRPAPSPGEVPNPRLVFRREAARAAGPTCHYRYQ